MTSNDKTKKEFKIIKLNKNYINKILAYILLVPAIDYVWMAISIGYLETGKYQWELKAETYFIGALPTYLLFIFIFIFGIKIGFQRCFIKPIYVRQYPIKYSINIIKLLLIFMMILIINIPFQSSYLDKHYINKNPSLILNIYFWALPYISIFLGYMFAYRDFFNKKIKSILFLVIIINIISIIGLGNKYSLLVSELSYFLFSYSIVILIKSEKLNIFKILMGIIILIIPTLSLYINNRINVDPEWQQNILDRLLLLQGGMWWVTFNDYINESQIYLSDLIQYWNMYPNESNITIGYLMQNSIGIKETRYIIENNGSYYSGAFPAIFLILSNNFLICLFILQAYGIILGYLYGKVIQNIICGNFIISIIFFSIILNISQVAGNGDISFILNINFYLKIFLLLIVLGIKKHKK
jgi:hypothetical protein